MRVLSQDIRSAEVLLIYVQTLICGYEVWVATKDHIHKRLKLGSLYEGGWAQIVRGTCEKRANWDGFGHLSQMPPGHLPLEVFPATGRRPGCRTCWRDYMIHLAWERLGFPQEELEIVAGGMDGWTDGWIEHYTCSVSICFNSPHCPLPTVSKTHFLSLHPAWSDVDAAIVGRFRPGQYFTGIPAVPEQGESLQAKTPGVPGGPAETGSTCTEASDQGWDLGIRERHHENRQGPVTQPRFVSHKVLQYKKRCGELEEKVLGKTSEAEKMRLMVGQEWALLV